MITRLKIRVNTIDKVKKFCEAVNKFTCRVTVYSEEGYIVNGKSLLGMFSLNLMNVLECELIGEQEVVSVLVKYLKNMNFVEQ